MGLGLYPECIGGVLLEGEGCCLHPCVLPTRNQVTHVQKTEPGIVFLTLTAHPWSCSLVLCGARMAGCQHNPPPPPFITHIWLLPRIQDPGITVLFTRQNAGALHPTPTTSIPQPPSQATGLKRGGCCCTSARQRYWSGRVQVCEQPERNPALP